MISDKLYNFILFCQGEKKSHVNVLNNLHNLDLIQVFKMIAKHRPLIINVGSKELANQYQHGAFRTQ